MFEIRVLFRGVVFYLFVCLFIYLIFSVIEGFSPPTSLLGSCQKHLQNLPHWRTCKIQKCLSHLGLFVVLHCQPVFWILKLIVAFPISRNAVGLAIIISQERCPNSSRTEQILKNCERFYVFDGPIINSGSLFLVIYSN